MRKPRNIIGRRFSALVVESGGTTRNRLGQPLWTCRCECSKIFETTGYRLRAGMDKNCGCGRIVLPKAAEKISGYAEIPDAYWKLLVRRSQARGVLVEVTAQQAWEVFLAQNRRCKISGRGLSFTKPRTAALERVDTARGFVLDNIQWTHREINSVMNRDDSAFIKMCFDVVEFQRSLAA